VVGPHFCHDLGQYGADTVGILFVADRDRHCGVAETAIGVGDGRDGAERDEMD
jgi:hypothetical protein